MKLLKQICLCWKLRRICRMLNIVPYKWQKHFAIYGKANFPTERRSGKTMAIVLRSLLIEPECAKYLVDVFEYDPDFWKGRIIKSIMHDEYVKQYIKCAELKIFKHPPVSKRDFEREITRRARHG